MCQIKKIFRVLKSFEGEHVFKWKSDIEDLLFNLLNGFISFKSKYLQFETFY